MHDVPDSAEMSSANVEVFVLAGGQSRRMGVTKASMEVDGTPLIATVAAGVAHLGPIRILGGSASLVDVARRGSGVSGEVTHLPDSTADPGPFVSIVRALEALAAPVAAIVSCDLALLTPADIDRLLDARNATDADLAVPIVGERRQWHALVVSSRIVPSLQERRNSGVQSLWKGFSGYSESLVVSPDRRFFFDVDTPEDVLEITSD